MVIKFSFVYLLLLFSTAYEQSGFSLALLLAFTKSFASLNVCWVVGYKLPLVPNYNFNQV